MENKQASLIIDKLTEEVVMTSLGMSPRSVRLARKRGFSGLHFETLKNILAVSGDDCPMCAFVWKRAKSK